MDRELFEEKFFDLPAHFRSVLVAFAKYPTERNLAYAAGYCAAYFRLEGWSPDNNKYFQGLHTWVLALIGQILDNEDVRKVVRETPVD